MRVSEIAAIVTGGASGLGAATARALAAEGARVTIFDRDSRRGPALAAEIGAAFAEVDVTSEASVQAGIATARAAMGGLSALVNCAGIVIGERVVGREGPHDLARFRQVIEVNLTGSFNCLRLAAAEMARNPGEEKGVIVNTASVAAFDGQKGQAAYAASKAGVVGLTLPAARELARVGVRVMTIAPGLIETPMFMGLPPEARQSLADSVPFPARLGRPEEYAALVLHIAANRFLNGETIRLDGALRMAPR